MLAARTPLFWAEKKEGPTVGSRKGHDAGIRRRNGNNEPRGRDSRNARTSCRFSATPTPVQKREPGHPSGPTAVARARAPGPFRPATRDDWRRSHSCLVAMDSSQTATCGRARSSLIRRELPGYSGRHSQQSKATAQNRTFQKTEAAPIRIGAASLFAQRTPSPGTPGKGGGEGFVIRTSELILASGFGIGACAARLGATSSGRVCSAHLEFAELGHIDVAMHNLFARMKTLHAKLFHFCMHCA